MVQFHPLTLNESGRVNSFLKRFPPEISEHTFTNLFAWSSSRPVWIAEVMESLIFVIAEEQAGESRQTLFGPPLTASPQSTLLTQIRQHIAGAVRIPASWGPAFKEAGMMLTEDRDNFDYVYQIADLATLSGRNFHKKRNHVKQCIARYHCTYEPITNANLEECIETQNRWCDHRLCQIYPNLGNENRALAATFSNFNNWDLIGGAIRIDGKVQAFAIAELLNPDTAVCHFEKAMPDFDGLGQLINHWFAKYSLTRFKYINREQDLGITGLRQAKKSYHPHHMVEKLSWLQP